MNSSKFFLVFGFGFGYGFVEDENEKQQGKIENESRFDVMSSHNWAFAFSFPYFFFVFCVSAKSLIYVCVPPSFAFFTPVVLVFPHRPCALLASVRPLLSILFAFKEKGMLRVRYPRS